MDSESSPSCFSSSSAQVQSLFLFFSTCTFSPLHARQSVMRHICYDSFFLPYYTQIRRTASFLSPPHPLIGLLYFYDLILLMRSHLATSRPVRYISSVEIRSTMYDTHLRATHTTTSSIRGVQIPIYLVSNTTDSL